MRSDRGDSGTASLMKAKGMGDLSREPSMEEILSSIRRVIARDEAQISGASDAPPPGPAIAGVEQERLEEEDVLDLTAASAVPPEAVDAPPSDVLPAHPETTPMIAPHAAPDHDSSAAESVPLVSPEPQAATRHTLDVLAAAIAQGRAQDMRPVDGDTTVNALVEAALRPMLRDWLDANLPAMVERIVEREIVRITGSRN